MRIRILSLFFLTSFASASCLSNGIRQYEATLGKPCDSDCIASFENYGCRSDEEYGRYEALQAEIDAQTQENEDRAYNQNLESQDEVARQLSEIKLQLQTLNDKIGY